MAVSYTHLDVYKRQTFHSTPFRFAIMYMGPPLAHSATDYMILLLRWGQLAACKTAFVSKQSNFNEIFLYQSVTVLIVYKTTSSFLNTYLKKKTFDVKIA